MRRYFLAAWFFLLAAAIASPGVYDWSKTAASNTTVEGISFAVGAMPPSNVGPGFRALFAAIKEWQEDTGCAVSSAGSANAYTLNVNSDPYSGAATFADGDTFCFVASFTNTSTATLNVESEGAKAIRKANDQALAGSDIIQNGHYTVHYDASANSAAGAWLLESATVDASNVKPTESLCVAYSDETTAITAATGKIEWRMPYAFTVTGIRGSLTTTQASGNIYTVDVNEAGTTIISTKITIDNGEETSTTAVTAPVISDSALADDALMTVDVDQIGNGTAKGGKVCLIGTRA